MIVRAYFVFDGEPGVQGLVPTLSEVPKSVAVATAAMGALLGGIPGGDRYAPISSAIPSGTRLLGLTIKNGVATVDLSTEFDAGGGTTSMQFRLAQVVYTLTQFSTVKSVVFQVEGQTVTVFSGEGIVLDGPVGRADFTDQLPSMFVDRPAFGAALGNPGRITGSANVFEATFRVAILDAAGKELADEMVDGHLRHRLLGHVRCARFVLGRQGAVGDVAGLRPVRSGRIARGHPRLPGLADTRLLTRLTVDTCSEPGLMAGLRRLRYHPQALSNEHPRSGRGAAW